MVTSPILHLSPSNDVLDHTNHIFSERLSSGDENDRDEDLQKDKYKGKDTQTKTNTKCFKDQIYVIFLKSREFKDLKYDMDMNMSDKAVMDMDVADTKTKTQKKKQKKSV